MGRGEYTKHLRFFQRSYFIDLLARTNNCVSEAARIAGFDRTYLHQLLRKLGVHPKRYLMDEATRRERNRKRLRDWRARQKTSPAAASLPETALRLRPGGLPQARPAVFHRGGSSA